MTVIALEIALGTLELLYERYMAAHPEWEKAKATTEALGQVLTDLIAVVQGTTDEVASQVAAWRLAAGEREEDQ